MSPQLAMIFSYVVEKITGSEVSLMKNYTVFRVRFVRKNDFGRVMAEAERGENYSLKKEGRGYIDFQRTHKNYSLLHDWEPGQELGCSELLRLSEGIHIRAQSKRSPHIGNPIVAATLIFSATPDFFAENDLDKIDRWARKSLEWVQSEYSESRVAQAVVHLDEATPHLHIFLVPIETTRVNPKTKELMQCPPRLSYNGIFSDNGETLKRARQAGRVDTDTKLGRAQTSYANAMSVFGLHRGTTQNATMDGLPEKKHKSQKQYREEISSIVRDRDIALEEYHKAKSKKEKLIHEAEMCEKEKQRIYNDYVKIKNKRDIAEQHAQRLKNMELQEYELLNEKKYRLSMELKEIERRLNITHKMQDEIYAREQEAEEDSSSDECQSRMRFF